MSVPNVLIVDDDPASRSMLGLSLRQAGCTVRTAGSGEEALLLLAATRYDWLVTDARMLPMTGFELSIRAKGLQGDIRILMVSAAHSAGEAAGCPIEGFFAKPVPVDKILSLIAPENR